MQRSKKHCYSITSSARAISLSGTVSALPGLSAWQIILIVAQTGRKRDPDSPMGEAPALGQIVEDTSAASS